MIWRRAGSSSVTRTSGRAAEARVVHRRAANSGAGNPPQLAREIAHDEITSVRAGGALPRNRCNQKIAHVRIVLGAAFA